jgi:acetyl-CoA C-acetyltransferase
MAPVTLPGKAGDTVVKFDEQPFKAKLDKIPGLKPAFKKDGTITAANASSISDGAAALVLMRESTARRWAARRWRASPATRCTRRRRSGSATAPAGAIAKVLKKAGWDAKSVNLWEVNEAFAAVTMAAMPSSSCRTRSSTCTAAPARWATRSAPAARASSSRCWAR